MLTDKQQKVFDQLLLTMRIINLSLALGVGAFAVYILFQGNKLVPFGSAADLGFLPPGLIAAVGGWLAAWIIPPLSIPANSAQLTATDVEAHDVLRVLVGAQYRMIITCAIFEGGAFACLMGFMLKHDPLHLAVAGVLLLSILLQFPRRIPLLDHVETRLREIREAKELSGATR